jgi:hypothetical protein
MHCITVGNMVDVIAFVRVSMALSKMSQRTSQRTSQRMGGCFEHSVAVLLETHLKYYETNLLAYFILAASEGTSRTRRHALREESMRKHLEDFVWDERQPRKSSRCAGFEHT